MIIRTGFMECAPCAAKSGSPELCQSCRHNQAIINFLRQLGEMSKPAPRKALKRWTKILGVDVRWWHRNKTIRKNCMEALRS